MRASDRKLRWPLWLVALAGCHLALGLEEATEVEDTGAGGAQGCLNPGQCNDDNPCTDDDCEAGTCVNAPLPDGDAPMSMQVTGDCKRAVCTAGELEQIADGVDVPLDNKQCTADVCNGTTPDNPFEPGGTACAESGGTVCDDMGRCVECFVHADCTVAGETCGGSGAPGVCGCTQSVFCGNLTCGTLQDPECQNVVTCNTGVQDGDETDVDCGGDITLCNVRCNAGKMCAVNSDCASNMCPAGVCQ